ncbi:hypothetical protein JVT61DRAFT_3286 [Boletus reticuloceps]|uniref:CUE domain-containing protein n=1 Tax=Boletus reticuloceps TaxID=495285 RepID=A0A8I3AAG6_9AGAM|nr:hypothetical protein JVT61DRAFT_3286 [Boletus reticuloceps]
MILSPSSPPESTQPVHAQPPMQGTDSTDPTSQDPHVASLKAIFPDFDDAVILSVLETTNNDHDHALDVLLGMNDPSFVPPKPPPRRHRISSNPLHPLMPSASHKKSSTSSSQEDSPLKNNMLPLRHGSHRVWRAKQCINPISHEEGGTAGVFNPRVHHRHKVKVKVEEIPWQSSRKGLTALLNVPGKKTFSSIVSKVKAKMQDYDQGSGWSWPQNPPPNQSPQTAPASSYSPAQQQGSEQVPYTQPYQFAQPANPQRQTSQSQPARQSTYVSSPPRSGVLRPAAAEPAQSTNSQQPSYYDPNIRGYDLYGDDEEIEINDRRTSTAPAAVAASASVTAQSPATPPPADNLAAPPPLSDTSSPPSYASRVSSPPSNPWLSSTSPPARSLSPTIVGVRGTKPGTPGGVDFSMYFAFSAPMSPAHRTLTRTSLRSQSPPATGVAAGTVAGTGVSLGAPRVAAAHSTSTADSSTDQEEPEFVENPFEDR